MALDYSIKVENKVLFVKVSGIDENLEEVKEYGLAVIEAFVQNQCEKVLCDESELTYTLSTFDTFESAKFIAELATPNTIPIAIVCGKHQLEIGKFWETVAVNRSLNVKMFYQLEDAKNWLELGLAVKK